MLDGGHVRRCSMGSIMEASPCARVEKRKYQIYKGGHNAYESPNKARIVEKPPAAAPFQLGSTHMIPLQSRQVERPASEDSCFIGHGEDVSVSCMYISQIKLTYF